MNNSNELYHYGTLGMKWGIRRYQNPDGSLTPEGKKRYQKLSNALNNASPADLKKRKYRKMREDLVMLIGKTTLSEISSKSEDSVASMTRDEWLKDIRDRTEAARAQSDYYYVKRQQLENERSYDQLLHPDTRKNSKVSRLLSNVGNMAVNSIADVAGTVVKNVAYDYAKRKGWIKNPKIEYKHNVKTFINNKGEKTVQDIVNYVDDSPISFHDKRS